MGIEVNKKMNVLIACEESQAVCIEFRKKGHNAFSCDIQECSGGHPEWHIQEDVLKVIEDRHWDMMIAHPECKYLCFSGERWLKENPQRQKDREKAFEFFMKLWNAPIIKKCIENSHSIFLNREFRKPTQSVHPYHFGEPFKKMTCLWLDGFQPLVPTNILYQRYPACHRQAQSPDRSKIRAKTSIGIAKAMADQWG